MKGLLSLRVGDPTGLILTPSEIKSLDHLPELQAMAVNAVWAAGSEMPVKNDSVLESLSAGGPHHKLIPRDRLFSREIAMAILASPQIFPAAVVVAADTSIVPVDLPALRSVADGWFLKPT